MKKQKFDSNRLQLLKSKLDLSKVVQKDIPLMKTGNRFMGVCPFHGGNEQLFSVNKDFYYCFGCKETGDVFSYIINKNGVSLDEAIVWASNFKP